MTDTINDYMGRLKGALAGADPALVQDALDDAEAHLRSEVAEGRAADVAVADYGAPEEVAAAYRENEEVAERHVSGPAAKPAPRGIFGIWADPVAWGSLVYFLLSLFTFIVYFVWLVVGLSLSFGLTAGIVTAVIGIPLFVLVMGSVRGLCLFEGSLVEGLLGVRMPRRTRWVDPPQGAVETAKFWLSDGQTWKSLAYLVLNFPVAVALFSIFITLFSLGTGLVLGGIGELLFDLPGETVTIDGYALEGPMLLVAALAGVAIVTGTLHLAKLLGGVYGEIVKSIHVNRTAT